MSDVRQKSQNKKCPSFNPSLCLHHPSYLEYIVKHHFDNFILFTLNILRPIKLIKLIPFQNFLYQWVNISMAMLAIIIQSPINTSPNPFFPLTSVGICSELCMSYTIYYYIAISYGCVSNRLLQSTVSIDIPLTRHFHYDQQMSVYLSHHQHLKIHSEIVLSIRKTTIRQTTIRKKKLHLNPKSKKVKNKIQFISINMPIKFGLFLSCEIAQ